MKKDFSHVQETTLYMEAVKQVIDRLPPGKLLDCPAGKGIIGDFARARGFTVSSADINEERKDFVYCDMDQPLPFADSEFDVSVSLEGVEHLLYPSAFLRELVRITKPGGSIILSTPNTANFYSRLQFLLTGTFFQFAPKGLRNIGDRKIDRGHISSLTPSQIHYFMSTFGAELVDFELDRAKKKIFWPLAALLYPFMAIATHNVMYPKGTIRWLSKGITRWPGSCSATNRCGRGQRFSSFANYRHKVKHLHDQGLPTTVSQDRLPAGQPHR